MSSKDKIYWKKILDGTYALITMNKRDFKWNPSTFDIYVKYQYNLELIKYLVENYNAKITDISKKYAYKNNTINSKQIQKYIDTQLENTKK